MEPGLSSLKLLSKAVIRPSGTWQTKSLPRLLQEGRRSLDHKSHPLDVVDIAAEMPLGLVLTHPRYTQSVLKEQLALNRYHFP